MNSTHDSAGKRMTIPVLTGPTGAGKTGLAMQLMENFSNLELISADSRQIYKEMSIGTDKPTVDEIQKYSMHLVDCIIPGERFTAFDFVEKANKIIDELIQKSKQPFVCGGTGLYIKSLTEGIVEIPDGDFQIRDQLEKNAAEKGPEFLHNKLQNIDPIEAHKVHPNNVKKVIRALEIYYLTGKCKSEIMAMGSFKSKHDFETVAFIPGRELLYERINARVDRMIENGLLDEVIELSQKGLKEKIFEINVIGYNELFEHLDGKLSLEEAVNLIKQNSRRYAKRQITWLRGMRNIRILNQPDGVLDCLINMVENQ